MSKFFGRPPTSKEERVCKTETTKRAVSTPETKPVLKDRVSDFFHQQLSELPEFELRHSQLDMALKIAEVLQQGGHLAVEAGTGTGKSLAYLVPLLLQESNSGKPVVIATKTLQLQRQLLEKDLPQLLSLLRSPKTVIQARGWSNYLCLRKLDTPSETDLRQLGETIHGLRQMAINQKGLVVKQDVSISPTDWAAVQADPLDCQKRQCPQFAKCGLFSERRALETADIIVTNHAFLLSDVKMRREGNSLLPDSQALVIDEAHRLEEVATEHLAIRVDSQRCQSVLTAPLASSHNGWLAHCRFQFMSQVPDAYLQEWSSQFDTVVLWGLKDCESLAGGMLDELRALGREMNGQSVLPHSILLSVPGERLANLASEFCQQLQETAGQIQHMLTAYDEVSAVSCPPELPRLVQSLNSMATDLEFLLAANSSDWVYQCQTSDPALLARPVDSSETLRAELFSLFDSCVMTSASLRVHGSFEFFLDRTGFANANTQIAAFESPFDIGESAFFGIANSGPEPGDSHFPESIAPALLSLLVGLQGRTLILTTSHKRVREYRELLETPLREWGIELLSQGAAPPSQLLKRFKMDGPRVLLGVDSFWEGVDIPGERLSCVVMTRLPFPVPTDSLFEARSERVQALGGNPFRQLSIPLTALKIKQGFGRLLRTSQDRGVFLLLDPRVSTKRYGKSLLRDLRTESAVYGYPSALITNALGWAEVNITKPFSSDDG